MNQVTEQHTSRIGDALRAAFDAVRKHTVTLSETLSEEDCCAQSMPDASPVKWHMAHTTWFFETFILERFEPGFQPHHPAFRMLFNSYYNGVGERHVRAQRGLLTRPSLDEVLAYRHQVDARMAHLMERAAPELAALVELGLQHEQQHQELMLTDVKHLLSMNPMKPSFAPAPALDCQPAAAMDWRRFDGGVAETGHAGSGFCFDNETPRHRQFIEPFALASRLVTNAEFLAFIEAGGYRDPALWLSEGWDWVCGGALAHPLYWQHDEGEGEGGGWREFTLHGLQPLAPHSPATHLSYYEADAFARWAGARLPTEAEWELAAANAVDLVPRGLHPRPEPAAHTASRRPDMAELFGACWQWTSSSYAPYPGYRTAQGAIGEYNGKFMVNQYVLRGSSCATPPGHSRASYRNFFPASARWQFSGVRLARSL
jgi:ergothioneine biosynthesis protein EgtB